MKSSGGIIGAEEWGGGGARQIIFSPSFPRTPVQRVYLKRGRDVYIGLFKHGETQ